MDGSPLDLLLRLRGHTFLREFLKVKKVVFRFEFKKKQAKTSPVQEVLLSFTCRDQGQGAGNCQNSQSCIFA